MCRIKPSLRHHNEVLHSSCQPLQLPTPKPPSSHVVLLRVPEHSELRLPGPLDMLSLCLRALHSTLFTWTHLLILHSQPSIASSGHSSRWSLSILCISIHQALQFHIYHIFSYVLYLLTAIFLIKSNHEDSAYWLAAILPCPVQTLAPPEAFLGKSLINEKMF